MSEIADIISQVGIPFACFFAMFYLCDKTINSIGELKEVVASLTELIRVQFGGGQDGIQSEDRVQFGGGQDGIQSEDDS